ncbi:lymphoid-specific helicase-like isoform X2 [Trichogramma pretiosum]|uniref:lymphoid-specific helicase-like isoform X2 n=1 Tax=Trichogramma pretiosum TaxID=7493 RepID=UPI0006C99380|nr:lymphoid-specific helicase-like isoform X2 [Trichogramma pretiosum]
MENPTAVPSNASNFVASKKEIKREEIDLCEDSGLSWTTFTSNAESKSSLSPIAIGKDDSTVGTIGEGIQFADASRIAEEQAAKLADINSRKRVKTKQEEALKAEKEAFEREVQETQYKRLTHLLNQSKAMTTFIMKKIDKPEKKGGKKKKTTEEDKNDSGEPAAKKLRSSNKSATAQNEKTSTTKSNRGKKRKLNLSNEEIQQELDEMSDHESESQSQETPNDFSTVKYFEGELRPYQKDGVNWLKLLYENGLNGILGDEMGLGKTVQVIALFAYLMEQKISGPYLVLVPLSTLPNWVSEFERFAPQLPVVCYYGNQKQRIQIQPKLKKKTNLSPNFSTLPIVLMSYEMVQFDKNFLRQFNWRYIVIDEAQRIKNYETVMARTLKTFNSYNRLLLTGTPLQNNLSELWSLLNFLLPDIFSDLAVFESWFDARKVQDQAGKQELLEREQKNHVLSMLREILQPFMLRRLKEDVCPDIPPIKEVVIYTPLTAIQLDIYSSIIKRDYASLTKKEEKSLIVDVDGVRPKRKCTQKIDFSSYFFKHPHDKDSLIPPSKSGSDQSQIVNSHTLNMVKMPGENLDENIDEWNKYTNVTEENVDYLIHLTLNDVMMYRHVVNHPYLIHHPLNDCGLPVVDENVIKKSGKLLVLDAMLKKLKARGHKVLLFSNFKMVLDIIEDYLSLTDYDYCRLDGNVKFDDRKDQINRFQSDPNCFLFMLTTRSGSVGLNLAAADTVIIYDSDWNPQCDLQAMARCHRIGQKKPVVVYRMCCKGTVDEMIIKRANAKRFLEKAVISKENILANPEQGLKVLKEMLEQDAFTIADYKNQVYTDAELDELLDRSDMVFQSIKTEDEH